jgi:hypothetical protein
MRCCPSGKSYIKPRLNRAQSRKSSITRSGPTIRGLSAGHVPGAVLTSDQRLAVTDMTLKMGQYMARLVTNVTHGLWKYGKIPVVTVSQVTVCALANDLELR